MDTLMDTAFAKISPGIGPMKWKGTQHSTWALTLRGPVQNYGSMMTGFLPLLSLFSTCQHRSPRKLRGWAEGANGSHIIMGNRSRLWGNGVKFLRKTPELMRGLYRTSA